MEMRKTAQNTRTTTTSHKEESNTRAKEKRPPTIPLHRGHLHARSIVPFLKILFDTAALLTKRNDPSSKEVSSTSFMRHNMEEPSDKHARRHDLRRAPDAFKDTMTHEGLQFAWRIAVRCVLHRCESQEIHCQG